MNQKEVDEIQRLARIACDVEKVWPNSEKSSDAWRDLCSYVMHIATDRVKLVLKAHEEGLFND